jgi:hypothetical protein
MGEVGHNLLFAGTQFGTLADHRHVHISNGPTRSLHSSHCLFQKDLTGATVILGCIVWEQLPNIRSTDRTKYRIRHGMHKDIAIRMRYWSTVVFKVHTTEDKWTTTAKRCAWLKPMQVIAVADAIVGGH